MRAVAGCRVFALCGVLLSVTSAARAHAPQARNLAVAPDGAAAVLALPGFGLLVRTAGEQPFTYVCDALLEQLPSDTASLLAYRDDGSLLVGTPSGMRTVAVDACPIASATLPQSPLMAAPIKGLVVTHAGAEKKETVFAVAGGQNPGLWRSDDGGRIWTLQSALERADSVTALRVSPTSAETLYVTRTEDGGASSLLVSSDAGLTFQTFASDRALTLLHIADTGRLWAVAPAQQQVGIRGFELMRADAAAGPWTVAQRINYFGGFTSDPNGELWLGDEGGGLYRSADAGEHFEQVDMMHPFACLTYAQSKLWACTPGTTTEPTLMTRNAASAALESVVAFAGVTSLVSCADLDVSTRCASAWLEWRRDVLMEPVPIATPPSAGTSAPTLDAGAPAQPDAGTTTPVPSVDAGAQDASASARSDGSVGAGSHDEDAAVTPMNTGAGAGKDDDSSGCSVRAPGTRTHSLARALLLLAAVSLLRRRRARSAANPLNR